MNDVNLNMPEKILLIRMLNEGDVAAIGVPALRFFRQKFPQADIHFLTFAQGKVIIELAEPDTTIKVLDLWPDDFFQAMEVFLGLAETIIGEAYQQIVNLDTAFMPCFLSRFLQDAGEPVSGNYLSISIEQMLSQVRDQSLQADYVNVTSAYMASSFFTMSRWHTNWWESDYLPDGGYPEFYLKQCCGFSGLLMDTTITLAAVQTKAPLNDKKTAKDKTVALCLSQSEDGYLYPHSEALRLALQSKGFTVIQDKETNNSVSNFLILLNGSDLMVAKPGTNKWLADAVGCPCLLVSGATEPKVFMPDFATDPTPPCPVHGDNNAGALAFTQLSSPKECNCDDPWLLADNIEAILLDSDEDTQHA
ncbi:glycosyltransferase family protein [Paraglaciecola hydrolytica]|uniref:ADP-heptose--LPS heptosyltransferase n=1 Tax=Paraglaciecola hydrolytica TaxID=1799789 RepID=A0A148KNT7_9ALTE|nr:hypothetical protein [Paraglaciecola hydrolytica]KXI27905.1 hypothetical protein AX660_20575 [Paraglaciecola hydrolytica]